MENIQTENAKETKEKLFTKEKNAWLEYNKEYKRKAFDFNEKYKEFLDNGKTERECTDEAIKLAQDKGFVNIDELLETGTKLETGMKVYRNVHNKSILMAVIGEEKIEKGVNIVGAHLDSPRLDLKSVPLYESNNIVLMKTHYFGGIRKHQWTAIPLALHGVIRKADGTMQNIKIGEDDKDPVFTITDLLPHLAKEQNKNLLPDGIKGEELELVAGSIPYEDSKDVSENVKLNILSLLNEKYGIKEEDFITAELEVVPAFKAKDVGFDRGLVGAYGQDDRSCSYTALKAITEIKRVDKTAICYLSDKEEVGSDGNTGAQSTALENFIADIAMAKADKANGKNGFTLDNSYKLRRCLENSNMLSADVTAAIDPKFAYVHDLKNASKLGEGVVLMKYTGSGGKGGSSDANAEYFTKLTDVFNNKGVIWKSAELGKVDQGGGGTIAKYAANLGINVIDIGVGVLGMHSPFEVTSKIDIYTAYKAYRKFYKMDNKEMVKENPLVEKIISKENQLEVLNKESTKELKSHAIM